MLRMPVIHTPPPVCSAVSWQQAATPVDQYRQADYAAPTNIIWHGDQTSTAPYFKEVETDPLRHEPTVFQNPFSPLFGFMGRIACTLLVSSFLALSGCRWFDELVGAQKTETTNTSSMRALSDSDLFIGKSRTVRLKLNRELSKRLRTKLEGEAYHRARALMAKDVRQKVKAAYPNDCHFGKFTFGYDIAWNHFSYSLETVKTYKNGSRLVRVLCLTTWKTGWCKRKYSSNRAKGISGSKIPYSIGNSALK